MSAKHSLLHMAVLSGLTAVSAVHGADFGAEIQAKLDANADHYFGIGTPTALGSLAANTTRDTTAVAGADASNEVQLASGLSATYLTRDAGNKTDMMAFWPVGSSNPTHLITCVEGGRELIVDNGTADVFEPASGDKYNPSVQRITLVAGTYNTVAEAKGDVNTILRGMKSCDGIRATPWGTVLATEETDDGGAYEIIDPLNTSEHTVTDRASGTIVQADGTTAAANIVKRTALPVIAWEGLMVLESGVVIAGDEERPGSAGADADGGAIFKFVPENLRTGTGTIATLGDSPLTAGSVYAMQVSCRGADSSSYGQHGQGCEIGHGQWISVEAATARTDANANGATGYYRPEDLHRDPVFADADYPNAVRFCWANTGDSDAENYAEVVCGIDYDPAMTDTAIPDTENNVPEVVVNRFVEGDAVANSFDNLAFQPLSGILYVIEDDNLGDIWACLPDGSDRDIKTDGCVHVLRVKTAGAEPTGFTFTPDGTKAYLSIQHSDDAIGQTYDDYATDDVIEISGFADPSTL